MRRAPVPRFVAVAIPAVGNLLSVAVWLPLLKVEPGAAIRPMRGSCYAILVAGITFFFGVPLGVQLVKKRQRRSVGSVWWEASRPSSLACWPPVCFRN